MVPSISNRYASASCQRKPLWFEEDLVDEFSAVVDIVRSASIVVSTAHGLCSHRSRSPPHTGERRPLPLRNAPACCSEIFLRRVLSSRQSPRRKALSCRHP